MHEDLVPPPVTAHLDRWRLDQLLAWEEDRMEMPRQLCESLADERRNV